MAVSPAPRSQSAVTVDQHGRFVPVSTSTTSPAAPPTPTPPPNATVPAVTSVATPAAAASIPAPGVTVVPPPTASSSSLATTIEADALAGLGALPGLISTGEAAANAVAAQQSVVGKIEAALSSVFQFVPPLVAAADPAAATLVTGIGEGLSVILAAVTKHAATTTASATTPAGVLPSSPAG